MPPMYPIASARGLFGSTVGASSSSHFRIPTDVGVRGRPSSGVYVTLARERPLISAITFMRMLAASPRAWAAHAPVRGTRAPSMRALDQLEDVAPREREAAPGCIPGGRQLSRKAAIVKATATGGPIVCIAALATSLLAAGPPGQHAACHPMAASCAIYADYPAAPDFRGTPAAPDLSSPDARRFRTVLRHAAAQSPNCGGHFTLATWGCGALCLTGAIIDARSGKVFFLPFSVSDARNVADPDLGQHSIVCQIDSELIVANGSLNGAEEAGMYFYRWHGGELSLIYSVHHPRRQ